MKNSRGHVHNFGNREENNLSFWASTLFMKKRSEISSYIALEVIGIFEHYSVEIIGVIHSTFDETLYSLAFEMMIIIIIIIIIIIKMTLFRCQVIFILGVKSKKKLNPLRA